MHVHMGLLSLESALMTLEGTGPVLEVAREVSGILRDSGIPGAIIGGVAVALHGYLRTTVDVDVLVTTDSSHLAEQLRARGFVLDTNRREFLKCGVPVHLVTLAQIGSLPQRYEQIKEIQTVSLADLINIKLRSGSRNILRAKDMGDVIGLIRHHTLSKEFLPMIDKDLRDEFRTLIDAIERESGSPHP